MENQPPPLPPRKLLVVDDDPVVVKALSMKLSGKGFAVMTAADGAEAVKAVRKEKPDLIILDVNFPASVTGVAWDAFRIVEWLRRIDNKRQIPVIIISGGNAEKLKGRSESIGAVGFFQKPVNDEEMVKLINKTLDEWPAKIAANPNPAPDQE